MAYTIRRVTPPVNRLVTAQEVKVLIGADPDVSNAAVERIIDAVTIEAEKYTRRAFLTQTFDLFLDHFPKERPSDAPWWLDTVYSFANAVEIPRPPLQSVTSIKVLDYSNNETTIDSGVYFVNNRSDPGSVVPRQLETWPTEVLPEAGVTIRFVAGYGDEAEDVPADIRLAVITQSAHVLSQRDPAVKSESVDNASVTYRDGDTNGLIGTVKGMLDDYRVLRL